MQMVQWEGGESVKEDDCGGKEEWCIVLRREKRKINVFVHRYVCVAAGLPDKSVAMRSWTFSRRKERG